MKRLFLIPVLLVLLTFSSSTPAADDPKSDQILKQLVEIQKRLDQMNKDMESRDTKFSKIEQDVAKLQKDLESLTKRIERPSTSPTLAKSEPPKMKVTENEGPLPPTVPLRTDPKPEPAKTVPFLPNVRNGDATVLIENTWSRTATVYVNGDYYSIPSGTSKTVRVVPGTFTYYVVEVHGYNPQTRSIVADETFKVNIHNGPTYTQQQQPYYYPSYCR